MQADTQASCPTALALTRAIDENLSLILHFDGYFSGVGLKTGTNLRGLALTNLNSAVVSLIQFPHADHELIIVATLHTPGLVRDSAHLSVVDIHFGTGDAIFIGNLEITEIGNERHIFHIITAAVSQRHLAKDSLVAISQNLIKILTCHKKPVDTALGINSSPQLVIFV